MSGARTKFIEQSFVCTTSVGLVISCVCTAIASGQSGPPPSLFPIDRFAIATAVGKSPCMAAGFREFDFWVGAWNVLGPTGDAAGTNRITRELDGCALEESWTDQSGGRGRSLNTYDAVANEWHQLWMDASGLNLRLTGKLDGTTLTESGTRPKSFGGPVVFERIAWTPLAPDRVRQTWEASEDSGKTWVTAFEGTYERKPAISPAPEKASDFCLTEDTRPRFHYFNFVVGDWMLEHRAAGGVTRGHARITKDLSGCLLVEEVEGPGGYRGRAFIAFSSPIRRWSRTYVDNRGVRVFLDGERDSTSMVLAGTKRMTDGSTVRVRVMWVPVTTSRIEQRWAFSSDNGATWSPDDLVIMTRR